MFPLFGPIIRNGVGRVILSFNDWANETTHFSPLYYEITHNLLQMAKMGIEYDHQDQGADLSRPVKSGSYYILQQKEG